MATAATTSDGSNKGIIHYYANVKWERILGEHMHQGYYGPDETADVSTIWSAQVRMIDEVLKFAGVSDDLLKKPKDIIDVGCGIGGTVRHLVTKYGANCCGIDLSPANIRRAKEITVTAGLGDKTSFVLGDALDLPFPNGQFDLVWTMGAIQHTPHTSKFVSELTRIAAPGASIIITATCHRDLFPGEESLKPDEKSLLNKINKAFHLSISCSPSDYVKIAHSLALQDFKMADWSENVTPYWDAMIQSYWTWRGLTSSLLLRDWAFIKCALAMPGRLKAYNTKLLKFIVIACRKPE